MNIFQLVSSSLRVAATFKCINLFALGNNIDNDKHTVHNHLRHYAALRRVVHVQSTWMLLSMLKFEVCLEMNANLHKHG